MVPCKQLFPSMEVSRAHKIANNKFYKKMEHAERERKCRKEKVDELDTSAVDKRFRRLGREKES